MKSATESEILTRFKERRVQVSKESQFDPAKTNGARLVLRELLAEKGHPDARVEVEVEDISATTVALILSKRRPLGFASKMSSPATRTVSQALRGAIDWSKGRADFHLHVERHLFQEKLGRPGTGTLFLGTKGYLQAKIGQPEIENAGKVSGGIPFWSRLAQIWPG
ncbi:MAG: hypothetical protein IPJ07_23505 [Acidobacteria bacterium]|nr:hypothetical protein [Acidobacteriota bacterium]